MAQSRIPPSDSVGTHTRVTSERSLETWYQNTTGGALEVRVDVEARSGLVDIDAVANVNSTKSLSGVRSVEVRAQTAGDEYGMTFVVPDGDYYYIQRLNTQDWGLTFWMEQPLG